MKRAPQLRRDTGLRRAAEAFLGMEADRLAPAGAIMLRRPAPDRAAIALATVGAGLFVCVAACSALLGIGTLDTNAAAPRADLERLRNLARLPRFDFSLTFAASAKGEFALNGETLEAMGARSPAERIADLRAHLKQDRSDASLLVELATLYAKTGSTNEAGAALQEACAYFREGIRSEPENLSLRTQLAWVLEDKEEAQQLMESAVTSPKTDARTWMEYGRFMANRAAGVLFSNLDPALLTNSAGAQPSRTSRFTAEQRVQAHRWLAEARRAFDQAVAIAPTNGMAYAARAGLITYRVHLYDPALEATPVRSGPPEILPPDALEDLQQAAKFLPEDPYAIATAAVYRAMNLLVSQTPPPAKNSSPMAALSDADRALLRGSMARLETLTRHPRREIAAGAWTALGALHLSMENADARAEEALRRALDIHPQKDCAWHLLACTLAKAERWQELERVASDRLKAADTAAHHIQLARAQQKLRRFDDMERNVRAALSHDANDLLVKLSFAAVGLMRHCRTEAELEELGQFLKQLEPEIARCESPVYARDFEFTRGLYLGLIGQHDEAARCFRALAEADPDEKEYKEALEALGR